MELSINRLELGTEQIGAGHRIDWSRAQNRLELSKEQIGVGHRIDWSWAQNRLEFPEPLLEAII